MIKQIVFGFLLCFLLNNIYAETALDDNFGAIEPDIEENRQNLQQSSQQQQSLNNLLEEIDKRYGKTASLLRQLHLEAERKRTDLDKLRLEIGRLKNEIAKQNKELAGQIKSAYAMGQQEQLKLLLNQQDPGLSSRVMIYYSYVNKARIAKIAEINQSVKRLEQLDKQNQQETALLEKKLAQKKKEQIVLDDVRKQRHELLEQINDDPSAEQLSHFLESETKLKNLIAGLSNADDEQSVGSVQQTDFFNSADEATEGLTVKEDFTGSKTDFSSLKGRLSWPVGGRLVQKFGSPRSDSVWDGVVIDAKEGTDIHAVNGGKVVYAEWLRGYGLLIIIDHGQGYMTLYAFNQSLYKRVGDSVNAGDVIASVGQSGGRSQSGLYFGIRKKGTPIDPLIWCGK